MELDVLVFRLLGKQLVDVADEAHQVGFAHVHLHLALVNLSEVHHLVDETQDALCIAADGLVDTTAVRVGVLFDERLQRCQDKRHRRADLMTDVHEEAQFGVGHLLGMDMLLQAQVVLLLAVASLAILQEEHHQYYYIYKVRKRRSVPRCVDDDLETALRGRYAVLLGHHAEAVAARLHVAEGNLVDAWRHAHPVFLVDAVAVDDMLGVVVGQRRQLYGKGVVAAAEYKAVGGDDRGVRYLPDTRHGSAVDGFAIDGKARQFYVRLPGTFAYVGRVKPCYTAQACKDQVAGRRRPRGTVAELVRLQSVVDEEVAGLPRLGIQAAQSVVGTYPEASRLVLFDGGDAVVSQSALDSQPLQFALLQVVAEQSVVGADV